MGGMRSYFKLLVGLLVLSFTLVSVVFAQEEAAMEQLFFGESSIAIGSLTVTDIAKTPASVTTITKEQIAITPARNIYDLIEVYVPGANHMNHYESTHIGMRGLIVDREYRYLLLVNGCVMNQTQNGIVTELESWDLNDIEKIDITRGPGSVTYGPGAIAGVISITTKNANTSEGSHVGFDYVGGYNSRGGYFSHGYKNENFSAYVYGSLRNTEGYKKPEIYYLFPYQANNAGGAGEIGGKSAVSDYSAWTPSTYYSDAHQGRPQKKIHAEINFLNEWKFWTRYTNSGTSRIRAGGQLPSIELGMRTLDDGSVIVPAETYFAQYVAALENNHSFSEDISLKSTIEWDTINSTRRDVWAGFSTTTTEWTSYPSSAIYRGANYYYNFAQSRIDTKSILSFKMLDRLDTALGFEYQRVYYGPTWGGDPKDFSIRDGSAITSGPDTNYVASGTNYYVGDNGFYTNTYSFFGEVNAQVLPKLNLIFSGRVDKDTYSEPLISPRLAAVWDVDNFGIIKGIVQKSVRMDTVINRWVTAVQGKKCKPEIIKSAEVSYSSVPLGNTTFNLATYLNSLDAMAWSNLATNLQGNLNVFGVDAEVKYAVERYTIGLNHAFAKQIDWKLDPNLTYSWYNMSHFYRSSFGGLETSGNGNDIMNWANHSTKMFATLKATKKLSFFGDMRIFWGYDGNKDWMEMYEDRAAGHSEQAFVNSCLDDARSRDLFGTDVRIDLSTQYQLKDYLTITVYGMNLFKIANNYRYSYTMGHSVALVEPTVYGVKIDCKF